ncbi:MAG: hypothetical protein ACF8MF_06920 [Phycisphaerales bacterium JB052]
MSICHDRSAVKHHPHESIAVSLPCWSWYCEECGPKRQRRLIAQAFDGAPNTFLTLTIRRDLAPDPETAAAMMSKAWRSLRYRALREAVRQISKRPRPTGEPPEDGWPEDDQGRTKRQVSLFDSRLPFLVVFEKHADGWPHMHVLCRSKWIAHRWLKAQWIALTRSPIVFVQRIYSRSKAAGYCAKYAGKASEKFGTTKRYWQSPDYQQNPREKPDKRDPYGAVWEISPSSIWQIYGAWRDLGYAVEWQGNHKIVKLAPHGGGDPP